MSLSDVYELQMSAQTHILSQRAQALCASDHFVHIFWLIAVVMYYWGVSMYIHRQKHTLEELSVLPTNHIIDASSHLRCRTVGGEQYGSIFLMRTVTPLSCTDHKNSIKNLFLSVIFILTQPLVPLQLHRNTTNSAMLRHMTPAH